MRKVLVVGANSYIGQKIEEYINHNYSDMIDISLVSASDGAWINKDFSLYDAVLHLSGIVHKKENKKQEKLYFKVNQKLAVEVAEKAKNNNVRHFIFMSTAAVYNPNETCITKETVPCPKSYYGKSKLAAENEIIQLHEESFKVAIIRLPLVYGEKCKGNYSKLVKIAKYMPIFPEYHNKRTMIHIDNLCEFIYKLILEEKGGYLYPQDEKYTDICELYINIRKSMGKKTLLIKNSNILIKALIPRSRIINKMFNDFYYN